MLLISRYDVFAFIAVFHFINIVHAFYQSVESIAELSVAHPNAARYWFHFGIYLLKTEHAFVK